MAAPVNRFISGAQDALRPLSKEAKGLRSPLSANRSMLSTLDNFMDEIEKSEAHKVRMYKIALVIVAVISFAISVALPIALLFGGGFLWIPFVLAIAGSALCALTGGALRRACARIENKYRSLKIYRQQLMNQNPSHCRARYDKYKYCVYQEHQNGRQFLDKIRAGLNKNDGSEGSSFCEYLDLAGDINYLSLQSDALVNGDGDRWYECITKVSKAKQALFQGSKGQNKVKAHTDLLSIASSKLTGVDMRMISQPGLLDIATSLMSLCGLGCQVGSEVERAIQDFERASANSGLLASNQQISSATQVFLNQGRLVLNHVSFTFYHLQRLVARLQKGQWLANIRRWLDQIRVAGIRPSVRLDKQLLLQLCDQGYNLCLHEGAQTEGKSYIKQCLCRLEEEIQALTDNENELVLDSDHPLFESIIRIEDYQKNECRSLHVPYKNPNQIIQILERELAAYLNSLGDLQNFRNQTHVAMRLGQYTKKHMDDYIAKSPEKASSNVYKELTKLRLLLSKDSWGASSPRAISKIVEEKDRLLACLDQLDLQLNGWRERYLDFYSRELSKLFSFDMARLYADLDSTVGIFRDTCSNAQDLDRFINQTQAQLGAFIQNNQSLSLTQEQVQAIVGGYSELISELQTLGESVHKVAKQVSEEATSSFDMVRLSISKSKESIADMQEKKTEELKKIYKTRRERTISNLNDEEQSLLVSNLVNMSDLVQNLDSLDKVLDKNIRNESVQSIRLAFQKVFASLNRPRIDQVVHLQEYLQQILDSRLNQIVHSSEDESSSEEINAVRGGEFAASSRQSLSNYANTRLSAFSHLLDKIKQSLRSLHISSSLITVIISLIFMVIGILWLSMGLTWLPIAVSVLLFLSEVTALGIQHFIKKKNYDVQVANLAKYLVERPHRFAQSDYEQSSLLYSFSHLQDALNLEGGELFVANETIKDFRNPFREVKNDSLQAIKKQFQKDSKTIEQGLRKRFGYKKDGTPKDEIKKEKAYSPEKQPTQGSISPSLEQIDRQNWMRDYLAYRTEMERWEQEKNYNSMLKEAVTKNAERFSQLQYEGDLLTKQITMVQQAISSLQQEESQQTADNQLIVQDSEQILEHIKVLTNTRATSDEKNAAKQMIDQFFSDSSWHPMHVYAQLEMDMCADTNELAICTRRDAASKFIQNKQNKARSSVNTDIDKDLTQDILKFLQLDEYIPFVSLLYKRNMFSTALRHLQDFLSNDDSDLSIQNLPTNIIQSALRSLEPCVTCLLNLAPFAYSLLPQEEEKREEDIIFGGMHKLDDLHKTLSLNIKHSRQSLITQCIKYIDKWSRKKLDEPHYATMLQVLRDHVQEPNEQSSAAVMSQLTSTPPFILRCLINELSAQLSLLGNKMQGYLSTASKLEASEQLVQSKREMMEVYKQYMEQHFRELETDTDRRDFGD